MTTTFGSPADAVASGGEPSRAEIELARMPQAASALGTVSRETPLAAFAPPAAPAGRFAARSLRWLRAVLASGSGEKRHAG